MAGPEDWGAVPKEQGPEDWGAQPAPDSLAPPTSFRQYAAGQLEQAQRPERAGLFGATVPMIGFLGGAALSTPEQLVNAVSSFFGTGRKAWNEGLTPDEEAEFGVNNALATIGSGVKFIPPKLKVPSAVADFHDQVVKPIAEQMVQRPVESPRQITVPLDPNNIASQFPPPGMLRSELAKTGEPRIDAVINASKNTIDNPVVDRTQDVPTGIRTEGGITYIDRNLPRAVQAGGTVFDPADPLIVRDSVMQRTASVLRDGGMSEETANRIAGAAGEKAENAWYAAHGIDKDDTGLPAIKAEEPSARDATRANNIVAKAELEPDPIVPPRINELQEARDLGVIGGPPEPVIPAPIESSAVAAQRAIPASARQGDKITMTPAGEQISEFERRFNYKMERIEAPEDFKTIWKEAASENNYFPDARITGRINPAHVEALAEAAGVDPTLIKPGYMKQTFDRPDEIRMAAQSLNELTKKFKEASEKYEADRTTTNKFEMLRTEILRDYALEQSTGFDAEWGHSGHALRSLMQARKEAETGTGLTAELKERLRPPKPVKDLTDSISKFKENAAKTVTATGKDKEAPLGLDKLIMAAVDLVDEAAKPVKEGAKPTLPKIPEVEELVKTARAVVNLMDIEQPKGPGVPTVRPLRALLTEKSAQGQNALAKFNKLVTEAEKTAVGQITQKGMTPNKALSPELADLVQRAENVTDYFGGVGLEKAIQDIMNGKGRTDEDMLNIARAVNRTDLKGAARLMSSMRERNPNILYWLWVQGLISGPFTHSKYILANALYSATERGVTTPIAAMLGKALGRADADRVLGGEAMAGAWGLIHGVPDAFRAIKETPWGERYQLQTEKILLDRLASTGEEIPKDLLRSAQPFGKSPISGMLGRILGTPGYIAGDIHTFFKVLNEEAGKSAEAYRASALEGNKISDPDFWDRLAYHKANLSTEALMQIRDDAYKGTYMQKLPESLERLQYAIKNGKYLRWIFPFTHIPINLMRTTLEHTPIAIADPTFRADILGRNGGRAQDKAIARMIVGSAIMAYFTNEYMQGRATGSYPTTQKERNEWKLEGKIPNATQIGDEWWSFERFGPIGALAGIGADIGHIISHSDKEDPENWTKMTWMAAEAAANAAADFPGFITLQNFFRAKEDPQQGARFAAWQAGSLLPFSSLISQTASFADPSMRRARTFVDGLMYRLPGLRETLAPTRDPINGEPVHNPGYLAVVRHTPVQAADPIKQELARIGYFPTAPKAQIGGVKLNAEQYDRYQATAGPLVKKALTELMSSPMWTNHNNDPDWQKEVAKSKISDARFRAARAMQAESALRDGQNNLVSRGHQRRVKQIETVQ